MSPSISFILVSDMLGHKKKHGATVECYDGIRRPVGECLVVQGEITVAFTDKEIHDATGMAPVALAARADAIEFFECSFLSAQQLVACLSAHVAKPRDPLWYGLLYVALATVLAADRSLVASLLELPLFIDTAKQPFSFAQLRPLMSASSPGALEFGASVCTFLHTLTVSCADCHT
jgi:hypothetical protein